MVRREDGDVESVSRDGIISPLTAQETPATGIELDVPEPCERSEEGTQPGFPSLTDIPQTPQ